MTQHSFLRSGCDDVRGDCLVKVLPNTHLDVVAQDLAVALGAALAQALATFAPELQQQSTSVQRLRCNNRFYVQ